MPVLAPLKPLFEAIFASGAVHEPRPVDEERAAAHAALERFIVGFFADVAPMTIERDCPVPVADDAEIAVRIYAPDTPDAPRPCHVYFHGGGFWLGRLDHFNAPCRALARDADCVVVSVDDRLAPEHRFPAAVEDAYAALLWVRAHADALGIDPARVSIGGMSAGANLAAVASLMVRDRGQAAPVLQVLEVPVTDLSDRAPLRIPAEGLELPSGKDRYCDFYLADPTDARLPYVSPLLAQNLTGLPPALVLCAEYDPLAAEGKAYANRLAAAGVPVEYHLCEGQFHGAQHMAKLIPAEVAAYHATIVNALRRAYAMALT